MKSPKNILLIVFFFLILNTFGQFRKGIRELVIYTDRECGLDCERSGGYTTKYVNGRLVDSVLLPCKINNKVIPYSKYIITEKSIAILKQIGFNKDTTLLNVYDLNGAPISKYYIRGGIIPDTIGSYIEYYSDGSIKVTGEYFKYKDDEYQLICKGCDTPRSVKRGLWKYYNNKGNLIKQLVY